MFWISHPTVSDRFVKGTVKKDIFSPLYEKYGSSKAKRLRAFWENEDDQVVGKLLEDLIAYYDTAITTKKGSVIEVSSKLMDECLAIALRLTEGAVSVRSTKPKSDDFLSKEFSEIPVSALGLPDDVARIIEQRIDEIKKCMSSGAPLSAIFLSGSILEGVLLHVATMNPKEFNQAKSSPKDSATGKVKSFHDWPLVSLIDVAYELKFLGLDVKKHCHSLRDFRNYIHPYEQMSSGFTPDSHTAEIGWKVLKAALHDIHTKLRA